MRITILGRIHNIPIISPSRFARFNQLIHEDGIIKWGVCKHPYQAEKLDSGTVSRKIGTLNNRPVVIANADSGNLSNNVTTGYTCYTINCSNWW